MPQKSDAWGIQARYEDASGTIQEISEACISGIRTIMGQPPVPPRSWFEDSVKVVRRGESVRLPAPATLIREDGTVESLSDQVPNDLPIGYHRLIPTGRSDSSIRLIVSPGRCHLPEDLRIWGWSAQLYATRSCASWGMGDLADLRRVANWAQGLGAGLLLINPLHAVHPLVPQEGSPYSPSSRRFLNPLYLRIEDLPGATRADHDLRRLSTLGQALNDERHIDRDRVFTLKQEALQLLWSYFEGDADFEAYCVDEGQSLHRYAVFCCLAERHGSQWREWPAEYRRADSPQVEHFAAAESDRVRFHMWLQWLLNLQLKRASQPVPLMQDLPIGFSPDGADAWLWQDLIASGVTVGAPPDLYNATGQNWGLPPFIPHKLRAAGYDPFIQTIRAIVRHAGGLRIDHVMGLFRLWWVPQGGQPKDGAYVRYAAEELLAIIAVESQRANALVVGEDLGTVEPGVREMMDQYNVLSYRLLWFEEEPPAEYPQKALAAVTTHDLPTIAGVWTGADLKAQEELSGQADPAAQDRFHQKLVEASGVDADADVAVAITRTFEQLAQSPSQVVMADLESALAVNERPNMPSATGKYPNWSLALPKTIEELEAADLPQRLAEILNRRVPRFASRPSSP